MFQFVEDFIGVRTIYKTKISFIGLGKLGMPCAEAIRKKGFAVSGFDIEKKSSKLIDIKNNLQDAIKDHDIIFVATPTPHEQGYDGRLPTSDKEVKDFDYSYVKDVLQQIDSIVKQEQIVVLISTVLPGTIRRELDNTLTNNTLIYNPYLIAMGTVEQDFYNPEMIMIGSEQTDQANYKVEILKSFYNQVCSTFPRVEEGTWEEAESIKIFYNTYISTKISFVNMIQDVAHKLGNLDVDKVTQALANSSVRITSSAYMKAGMGDGGSCHPRDNIALRWLAKNLDLGYDMFENIMNARETQAKNMAKVIVKHSTSVAFTSDSYKPGTDLVDGSYSLLVQHFVTQLGGTITDQKQAKLIVKVHPTDKIVADNDVLIFDPWRSHTKAKNVIYYGK